MNGKTCDGTGICLQAVECSTIADSERKAAYPAGIYCLLATTHSFHPPPPPRTSIQAVCITQSAVCLAQRRSNNKQSGQGQSVEKGI